LGAVVEVASDGLLAFGLYLVEVVAAVIDDFFCRVAGPQIDQQEQHLRVQSGVLLLQMS
jgi:hypothetical protein